MENYLAQYVLVAKFFIAILLKYVFILVSSGTYLLFLLYDISIAVTSPVPNASSHGAACRQT